MKFRPAEVTDASSIAALSIEVWIGTYLRKGIGGFFADYALEEFTKQKMEALLCDPQEIFIVSENEEGIDGFIRISLGKIAPVDKLSETEISTLYVQPRHHGKGLGKGLLGEGFRLCRERSIPSVWLATNAENTPAIEFYLSFGFEKVGQTHFCIQDQAYLNEVFMYDL